MNRYRFTPQAEDDLFEIWSFIAQDSVDAANKVESAVLDACERIAHHPLIGAVRSDLTPLPVRFWLLPSFRNYFIVYDPETNPLQVVRILHAAREIGSVLP